MCVRDRWRAWRRGVGRLASTAALVGGVSGVVGCESKPYVKADRTDYRPRRPEVSHHVSGAFLACAPLDDNRIAVAQGGSIQILNAMTGEVVSELEVVAPGAGPTITDLASNGDMVYGIVAGRSIITVSAPAEGAPELIGELVTETMGIAPIAIAPLGTELVAFGDGGAVFLADGSPVPDITGDVRGVAGGHGVSVVLVDGNLVADGHLLTTADSVLSLPAGSEPFGGLVVARHTPNGALLLLLGPGGEMLGEAAVPGRLERLRLIWGRLYAVTPAGVWSWRVDPSGFLSAEFFAIKGALDLAPTPTGDLFVCGSFGRALYHPYTDSRGPGDTFFAIKRAPGRLETARGDGRRVRAGSQEGIWNYRTGMEAEITSMTVAKDAERREEAIDAWGVARIVRDEAGQRVEISLKGEVVQTLAYPVVSEVLAEGEALWVAHGDGVDVYKQGAVGLLESVAKFEFGSPVIHIFAENTGGIAYVTHASGMGTIDWIPYGEAPEPSTTQRENGR
ncbi:MAG: hypothetical protein O2855_05795 [Planctomycetota bacterium]|nr:hypothetical protein [Planctomycetota bacterium]